MDKVATYKEKCKNMFNGNFSFLTNFILLNHKNWILFVYRVLKFCIRFIEILWIFISLIIDFFAVDKITKSCLLWKEIYFRQNQKLKIFLKVSLKCDLNRIFVRILKHFLHNKIFFKTYLIHIYTFILFINFFENFSWLTCKAPWTYSSLGPFWFVPLSLSHPISAKKIFF